MKLLGISAIYVILSSALSAQVYKEVAILKPQKIEIDVKTYDPPLEITNGQIEKREAKQHEALRTLLADWSIFLDPKISKEDFLSFYYLDSEERIQKYTQWYSSFATKFGADGKGFLITKFAKTYSKVYVRGIVFFRKSNEDYCYIDYNTTGDFTKDTAMVIFGKKDKGVWKNYNDYPKLLDFGPFPWGNSAFMEKAIINRFLYYSEDSNSLNHIKLQFE